MWRPYKEVLNVVGNVLRGRRREASQEKKGKKARMGAEPLLPKKTHTHTHTQPNSPLILGLQPSALIDHVAKVDSSLLAQIPGERGGSIPVRTPSLLPVSFSFSFSFLAIWWFCVNVFGCC